MAVSKMEVKKIIKKELGDFLKKFGYKFESNAQGFIRYFDSGFNKVGVVIVDYRPKFQLSPFFLIRINEVENIIQNFIFVHDKYREFTWTLNAPIEYFTGVKEYDIRNQEEMEAFVDQIKNAYSSQIEPFLNMYSSVKNLDTLLNAKFTNVQYMANPANHIRPIIIAKITSNENFEKVAAHYLKKYTEDYYLDTDEGPNKIREVIGFLKTL
jgi:hypothetical protein